MGAFSKHSAHVGISIYRIDCQYLCHSIIKFIIFGETFFNLFKSIYLFIKINCCKKNFGDTKFQDLEIERFLRR